MNKIRNIVKSCTGFLFSKIAKGNMAFSRSLTIFVFHDISNQPSQFAKEYGLCIPLETFRMQCKWIKLHFNVVHPADLNRGLVLPKNAAIISFDDGFLGSFENGLTILEELKLPSILFLNMGSIINKTPLLSAAACYLNRSVPEFSSYAKRTQLKPPFHLTLSPSRLSQFMDNFASFDLQAVSQYQGSFADFEIVRKWSINPLVTYGNHLYEHWNSVALTKEEFQDQYKKNENILLNFKNWLNFFAFTNGQPFSCFTNEHLNILKELGAVKVFSSLGGVNENYRNDYLLGRISLGPNDNSSNRLWFRVARALNQDSTLR